MLINTMVSCNCQAGDQCCSIVGLCFWLHCWKENYNMYSIGWFFFFLQFSLSYCHAPLNCLLRTKKVTWIKGLEACEPLNASPDLEKVYQQFMDWIQAWCSLVRVGSTREDNLSCPVWLSCLCRSDWQEPRPAGHLGGREAAEEREEPGFADWNPWITGWGISDVFTHSCFCLICCQSINK